MAEDVRPEYANNRQDSENVSYNTQRKVILQVHEYLLRDELIQIPFTDIRQSIWKNNYSF